MAFLLSLITCGIYSYFYVYYVSKSLNEMGMKRGYDAMDPTLVLVLTFFFGVGLYINIYSGSEISKRIAYNQAY